MATIAFKQPNGLLCIFSTVSCGPIACNLTEAEFVNEYVDKSCTYRTIEQQTNDALDACRNHARQWSEIYDYYIPQYARGAEEIEAAFERLTAECSKIVMK